ncbi:MAG: DUF4012 domain-containing protein [Aestuariivirga sp.]|uniref:DUF4012 domain-containing protein n=1 Tax=Aestuariivirga sp. TaxID=2650926 RepID=UPI00301B2C0D
MANGICRARRITISLAVIAIAAVVSVSWLAVRGRDATSTASILASTITQLRSDVTKGDLTAVAGDITSLHSQAAHLHDLTGDPIWGLAALLPGVGARASAARTLGASADSIAAAAAPLAELLPKFDKAAFATSGGKFDVEALTALAPVLEALATNSEQAAQDLASINQVGLTAAQAEQVKQAREALSAAIPALRSASAAAPLIGTMLGSSKPHTWFIAMENLAEARGTGGLIGAYAILRTDAGKVSIVEANSRKRLDSKKIPVGNLPAEFQDLWASDAAEWAGLNLSPHFPYTGQLIVNGWKAQGGGSLDGVVALDQRVVAALLAGTGPVSVRGVTVDSTSAFTFLTKDIYAKFPVVADKDAVVVELLKAVFQRIASGQVSLAPLVKALKAPVTQGDLLVYSVHKDEQAQLARYSLAGILPDQPGPFAMAVVNNGGGNKLDAYISVEMQYDGGTCTDSTRTSEISVIVHNSAPSHGLPSYVDLREDLPAGQNASAPKGSTKVLLYIYGPVKAINALTTIDGQQVSVSEGLERGHPVWRVDLVLNSNQTRSVDLLMLETGKALSLPPEPATMTQPMSIPQKVSGRQGAACTAL